MKSSNFTTSLLLCAVFRDGYLHSLVDAKDLQNVLDGTVNFLKRHAAISPTFHRKYRTLEEIQRILF